MTSTDEDDQTARENPRLKETSETYRALGELPEFQGAHLSASGDIAIISAFFSVRSYTAFEKNKFSQTFTTSSDKVVSTSLPLPLGADVLHFSPSPSGKRHAIFRKKGNDEGLRLEFWSSANKLAEADLGKDSFSHLYGDGSFGSPSWSQNEQYITFVIEEPVDPKPKPDYLKFAYVPDYGETLTGKRRASIYVAQLIESPRRSKLCFHKVTDLASFPELAFGQPVFLSAADDDNPSYIPPTGQKANKKRVKIVATAYPALKDAGRLGLVYCTNRPSMIYLIDVLLPTDDEKNEKLSSNDAPRKKALAKREHLTAISDHHLNSRSPRVLLSRTERPALIYVSGPLGGSHSTCNTLKLVSNFDVNELKNRAKPQQLVGPVRSVDSVKDFPGLYFESLPRLSFLQIDGQTYIVCSSVWGSRLLPLCISLNGKITRLDLPNGEQQGSLSILTTDGQNGIVAVKSGLTEPPSLWLGRLDKNLKASWTNLLRTEPIGVMIPEIETDIIRLPDHAPTDVLLIKNKQADAPLMTIAHGGPNATFCTTFSPQVVGFVLAGFSVALVNYPGSLGYGSDPIDELTTKLGELEVGATLAATRYAKSVLKLEGKSGKTLLLGGSHSGFISCHLTARWPDEYDACVIRNPVTDLVAMAGQTDIPDWCESFSRLHRKEAEKLLSGRAQLGLPFEVAADEKHAPPRTVTPEAYAIMERTSPSHHLGLVSPPKTPTLLLLGQDDRRVPPAQGIAWYHALRGMGVETEACMFPNNGHALDGVEAELRVFEASVNWFYRFSD